MVYFNFKLILLIFLNLLFSICWTKSIDNRISWTSFRLTQVLPVLHNVQLSHIAELGEILKHRSHCSLSLRHAEATKAIEELSLLISSKGISCKIGAATVVSEKQAEDVLRIGAKFLSTTFCSPQLIAHSIRNDIPLLCGVQSLEDCKIALSAGAKVIKIYPVSTMDPVKISSITSLDKSVSYLASGGVNLDGISKLPFYGITMIAVGFDLAKRSIRDVCKELEILDQKWMQAQEAFAIASNGQSKTSGLFQT